MVLAHTVVGEKEDIGVALRIFKLDAQNVLPAIRGISAVNQVIQSSIVWASSAVGVILAARDGGANSQVFRSHGDTPTDRRITIVIDVVAAAKNEIDVVESL